MRRINVVSKKKIIQFRFFGEHNYPHTNRFDFNQPSNITIEDLYTGVPLAKYFPIEQLRITTLPGVKFRLDSNISPSVIGASGVYQIDKIYNNITTCLVFEKNSLEYLDINPDGFLIIDIVYQEA